MLRVGRGTTNSEDLNVDQRMEAATLQYGKGSALRRSQNARIR